MNARRQGLPALARRLVRAPLEFARRLRRAGRSRAADRAAERATDRAWRRLARRPAQAAPLDLALVVPAHNDTARLNRLLAQARALGVFSQIVVIDDGSDPPVPEAADLDLLRLDTRRGGGTARNAGLARVRAAHLLFFDSDDLLTPDLPLLLADLAEAQAFDFCLFRHADSRVAAEPRWGQPDWDEALWQAAGHGTGALRPARPAALPILAQTANYPWNKIYRTGFLRDHAIGCAETEVHQDIPLHWLSFLAAGRVLVSDRICAWHAMAETGTRLSNRRGAERLQVFAALDPVAAALPGADPAFAPALARFVLGLLDWIEPRLDPALLPRLHAEAAVWLKATFSPFQSLVLAEDAALAAALAARIGPP